MKNGKLTYQQLANKLQTFGYRREQCKINGSTMQAFEHAELDSAVILLPDAPPDRIVETPYMHKVLIILKTHGLIEEQNPLLN